MKCKTCDKGSVPPRKNILNFNKCSIFKKAKNKPEENIKEESEKENESDSESDEQNSDEEEQEEQEEEKTKTNRT